MVAAYRLNHPGIELYIHDGVHGTVIEDVRSGAADFGYLSRRAAGPLHFSSAGAGGVRCCAAPQSSARCKGKSGLDLGGYRWSRCPAIHALNV